MTDGPPLPQDAYGRGNGGEWQFVSTSAWDLTMVAWDTMDYDEILVVPEGAEPTEDNAIRTLTPD